MRDEFYFACLAVVIISAIATPICAQRLFARAAASPRSALICGMTIVLGFACSLPFGGTREMPWLSWLAGIYFGSAALGIVFYGVARRSP